MGKSAIWLLQYYTVNILPLGCILSYERKNLAINVIETTVPKIIYGGYVDFFSPPFIYFSLYSSLHCRRPLPWCCQL